MIDPFCYQVHSTNPIVRTPQFLGVIPGGNSFTVPEGTLTNVTNEGTGFSWTPSVRGGTTFILIGGDNRGQGTGGSVLYTVSQGDNSCLDNTSPSSTPGSPAGGTSPTASSSPSSGGSSPFVQLVSFGFRYSTY